MDDNDLVTLEWTGISLVWLGALLMVAWLVMRFIAVWPNNSAVAVGEIIAFILVGALLMVLGVNLCVLPAKHKQDITRTVRTATASLDHSIARLHQVVAIEPRAVNLAAAQEQSQELARSIREAAADLVDSIKGLREILTSQLPAPEAAANQQDNKGTPSDGRSHDRQTSPGGKMDK